MSFDPSSIGNKSAAVTLDYGNDKPKSGKKKWLFVGCGCLSFLALLCVGGGTFLYIQYGKPLVDLMTENSVLVQNSQEVKNKIGSPVTVGPPARMPVDDPAAVGLSTPVSGPKGSGNVVMRAKFDGKSWVREELYLEINGERVNLNPEKEFELKIDDGL